MPFFDHYPYTNFHNVNLDWILERVKAWGQMVEDNNTRFENLQQANENFKEYVTNYLQNLDIQAQIDDKLDRMFESGELTEYFQPYVSATVTTWLEENITEPEGVIVDSSLTVAGACADSKAVGDKLNLLAGNVLTSEIKSNLLACFRSIAFFEENGYLYNNLYNALYRYEPLVYEILQGTDISTWSIDTDQHAYTLDENFTILAKVSTNTAGTDRNGMILLDSLSSISSGLDLVGARIQANMNNGNITFRIGFNGAVENGGVGGTGTGIYNVNEQHTVSFVIRNNNKAVTARIYVDGNLDFEMIATLRDKTTPYPPTYYVGKTHGGSLSPWLGIVNVFRIYNVALSDNDISNILNI